MTACCYCGRETRGALTCASHADLVGVDANMASPLLYPCANCDALPGVPCAHDLGCVDQDRQPADTKNPAYVQACVEFAEVASLASPEPLSCSASSGVGLVTGGGGSGVASEGPPIGPQLIEWPSLDLPREQGNQRPAQPRRRSSTEPTLPSPSRGPLSGDGSGQPAVTSSAWTPSVTGEVEAGPTELCPVEAVLVGRPPLFFRFVVDESGLRAW